MSTSVQYYKSRLGQELKYSGYLDQWPKKSYPNCTHIGDILDKTPHELYLSTTDHLRGVKPNDSWILFHGAVTELGKENILNAHGRKIIARRFFDEVMEDPECKCKLYEALIALENMPESYFSLARYETFKRKMFSDMDTLLAQRDPSERPFESAHLKYALPEPPQPPDRPVVFMRSEIVAALKLPQYKIAPRIREMLEAADKEIAVPRK